MLWFRKLSTSFALHDIISNKKIVLSLLLFSMRKKTIITMKKNAGNVHDVLSDQ